MKKRETSPLPAFDRRRLKETIHFLTREKQTSEEKDFPERVVQMVEETLATRSEDELPSEVELKTFVVESLHVLNRQDVVAPYLSYCRERESVYQKLQAAVPKNEISASLSNAKILVGPTAQDEYLPWDSIRIAQALEKEGAIPAGIAREVAQEVEKKVLDSGCDTITTALIRELVNSELFLKGHRYYLNKQSLLGIPKFDFNNILYSRHQQTTIQGIASLTEEISRSTLRQYALEEVYSQDAIKAHLSGAIHIEGLGWPVKFFMLSLRPPFDSVFGNFSEPSEWLVAFLADLQKLSSFVTHSVDLYDVDGPHSFLDSTIMRAFFTGISRNFTTSIPCRLILQNSPNAFTESMYQFYQEADKVGKSSFLPHLVVPFKKSSLYSKSLGYTNNVCQMALEMHNVAFLLKQEAFFSKKKDPLAKCVMDSIVIDLVQAACKAGAKQIELFHKEIKNVFGVVVKAHLDKKRFLFNLSQGPLKEFFEEPFQSRYTIEEAFCFLEVSGLPEAVKYLCGQEMHEEEGWETAIQTLACLQDLCQSIEEKHGIQIKMVDYNNQDAAQRFQEIDMARFPELESILPPQPYTAGPHFKDDSPLEIEERLKREGELHRYVSSCVNLKMDNDPEKLKKLLKFAMEETSAIALRIVD